MMDSKLVPPQEGPRLANREVEEGTPIPRQLQIPRSSTAGIYRVGLVSEVRFKYRPEERGLNGQALGVKSSAVLQGPAHRRARLRETSRSRVVGLRGRKLFIRDLSTSSTWAWTAGSRPSGQIVWCAALSAGPETRV